VIERKGLFCALYSDRGAHFWLTPKRGGKVDYERPTQVGRAMKELGVQMIPSYSPQARGRRNGTSPPGKDGCRRSCACTGSGRWKGPTSFSPSNTWPSSTAALRFRQRSEVRRLYPVFPILLGGADSLQCHRDHASRQPSFVSENEHSRGTYVPNRTGLWSTTSPVIGDQPR